MANLLSLDSSLHFSDYVSSEESRLAEELIWGMDEFVVAQDDAKKAIAQSLINGVYNVYHEQWVLGAVFLAWPTGVGKTELVRAIANTLFWDPEWYTKVDAWQMVHPADIAQLTGSAPGYIGYGDTPKFADVWVYHAYEQAKKAGKLHPLLTQYNMQKFSIVLVDEVEKAHPDVINVFLNVLQSGRMDMSSGKEGDTTGKSKNEIKHSRTTDFTNTLFVFTSNVWEKAIASTKGNSIGFTKNQDSSRGDYATFERELKRHFPPEFIGRVDIVRCHPLTQEHLREAMRRHIARMNRSIQAQNYSPKTQVLLSDPYIDHLFGSAKDIEYGARAITWLIKQVGTHAGIVLRSGKLQDQDPGSLVFDMIDGKPNMRYISTRGKSLENFPPEKLDPRQMTQLVEWKIQTHAQKVRDTVKAFCELIVRYDSGFLHFYKLYRKRLLGYGFKETEMEELEIQLYRDGYNSVIQPQIYEEILHNKGMFAPMKAHSIERFIAIAVGKNFSLEEIYFHIRTMLSRPITAEEQIVIGQHLHRCIQLKNPKK